MTLSLAMIVKDEAACLGRCLDSVRGLVDEVAVLDTGSRDGTPELARARGARVESLPWPGDFAAARNASIRLCSGEWILVLDADETIDGLDHPVVLKALAVPEVAAWSLEIRNHLRSGAFIAPTGSPRPDDGKYALGHSHHWPQRTLRLFRRQPGDVYTGRVHEQAVPYFAARGLAVGSLDAVIHHFGKLDALQDRAKQHRYLALAREEAALHPEDPSAHYNVLQEALMLEEWESVLASAQACLSRKDQGPLLVYVGAATALRSLGRAAEALPWLDPVLAARPGNPVAHNARGECLQALDRPQEAQEAFLRAMDGDPAFTLPFLNLVKLLEGQGRTADARRVLEAGLDQNPRDLNLWTALVSLSSRAGELGLAARDAWDALRALPDGGQGLWHQLVAHALLAQGHPDDARRVVQQGLAVFPGQPDLVRMLA